MRNELFNHEAEIKKLDAIIAKIDIATAFWGSLLITFTPLYLIIQILR